ncbi:MAG: DUF4386 domain-containing protein [bacterium]
MSRQSLARLSGTLYLLMGLPGAFALVYMPSTFLVHGEAAATAARIAASPMLYRSGVFAELICGVFAIWLGMVLYELFKDVDRGQARLMVGFVFGMVAIGVVSTVALAAPIVFTSGSQSLSAFTVDQLNALTLASWSLRSQSIHVATMYWGLWLLPLGTLINRSGFLPRWLGVLVLVAGWSYVINSITYFFLPAYSGIVNNVTILPQAAGELGFTLWMLIKGVGDSEARYDGRY